MLELSESIKRLNRLSHSAQLATNFPAYIQRICFPYFKNLEAKTTIKFDFPLTVFIGQNGCGKSSALQALYGCPDGYSTGIFWFNTFTDPIPEQKDGILPSFWFEYFHPEAREFAQVLKYRTQYKRKQKDGSTRIDPDYWEPARPGEKYGMKPFTGISNGKALPGRTETRWEGLEKTVVYLDFRAELSAFDKYFYFAENPTGLKRIKSKQDFLRKHSHKLQNVFDGVVKIEQRGLKSGKKKKLNKPKITLPPEELEAICTILGKEYASAQIVQHSFYKQEGFSVRFETLRNDSTELHYTEAFAGSGEMSIVTLVHKIFSAEKNSLILLDEPEVSLHPGAQKRMVQFLLDQIVSKRHQIVLCTHCSTIIEGLPPQAIKLFSPTPEGYFKVYPEIKPELAFLQIGQTVKKNYRIIVEDESSKQLLEKVLQLQDHDMNKLFEVTFHPGGAKDIYKEAVTFARVGETNRYFFLDGDQNPNEEIDLGKLGDEQLDAKIEQITKINAKKLEFTHDSGKPAQTISEKRKYLEYIRRYFRYFAGKDPEETIILATGESDKPEFATGHSPEPDSKKAFAIWVAQKVDNPNASDFSTYRKQLLKTIDKNHQHIRDIVSALPNCE